MYDPTKDSHLTVGENNLAMLLLDSPIKIDDSKLILFDSESWLIYN